MFNESDRMTFNCNIILDEDLDEEDESDNDHPASDPDFSGTRRTNTTTQSVLLYPSILYNFFAIVVFVGERILPHQYDLSLSLLL